jgi:hypothetical protein
MRAAVVLLAIGLVGVAAGCGGTAANRTAAAPRAQAGCRLQQSPDGYPDEFAALGVTYVKHPPLPRSGWYASGDALSYRVMFHSIFHGYVLVRYRDGLPPGTARLLRSWVAAHERARVAATPAALDRGVRVDIAEWGHEWRCTAAAAVTPKLLARVLALRGY